MATEQFENVSLNGFIDDYMQGQAQPFGAPSQPIQVFPLRMAVELMRPPTPLFRTQYNFLLLFTGGGGRQQVDNELITLATNEVLFIREGHLNAILEIDPATKGYFIYIDSTLLPRIVDDATLLRRFAFYPKHTVPPEVTKWLAGCCQLLADRREGGGAGVHLIDIQCALLRAMMMKIADTSAAQLIRPDRPSEITMRFRELVYAHHVEQRTVRFYADRLAVTQNYLNRCVKQVTGRPPKQHINETVVQFGKVLLLDRSKTISEVAFSLNFSDAAHFGRLFRQLTGLTPSAYRAAAMHGLSDYVQPSS